VSVLLTIDELARASRPQQFALLGHAGEAFRTGVYVSHLLVRGSLATGTADRMSDVDFVIGVRDGDFKQFVGALDLFMTVELGAILPGWRDTIVSRMGGLGYVFLVASDGGLYQIDTYVVPESVIPAVQVRTGARVLFGDVAGKPEDAEHGSDVAQFVERELNRPLTCSDLVVEILVLIQMMRKRIKRGQRFVVYSETFLLLSAVKELVKKALSPTSTFWGWYNLDEEIGVTSTGRACLDELVTLIDQPPIRTLDALASAFRRIEGIIGLAAPESLDAFRPAVDAYKHYLDLA
jgi:hypothetical protein